MYNYSVFYLVMYLPMTKTFVDKSPSSNIHTERFLSLITDTSAHSAAEIMSALNDQHRKVEIFLWSLLGSIIILINNIAEAKPDIIITADIEQLWRNIALIQRLIQIAAQNPTAEFYGLEQADELIHYFQAPSDGLWIAELVQWYATWKISQQEFIAQLQEFQATTQEVCQRIVTSRIMSQ